MSRQDTASPHARACHDALVASLRGRGHHVRTVDEAIRRGIITDLDWCDALERYRVKYGVLYNGRRVQ